MSKSAVATKGAAVPAKVFIGAAVRTTVCVKLEDRRVPLPWHFYPNRINPVPYALWEKMLAKKSSPGENGEDHAGPVEMYLQSGVLWQMDESEARAVHTGERALRAPKDVKLGPGHYTPPEPDRPISEAQARLEAQIMGADPSPDKVDLGEVSVKDIKPPPRPAAPAKRG